MRSLRLEGIFLFCLVLTFGFGAAASAAPADKFGPGVGALVAEAAREGRLQLSWSGGSFGDNGKYLPQWIEGFNRFYGLSLPYTYTPAPTMAQQSSALIQASEANAPAASDVVILGPDNLLPAMTAHATHAYDWPALAKEVGANLPAAAVAPGGAAVAFATAIYGITYNKNAVSAAEMTQTLAEVLNPKWKGRVAAEPHAAGFNLLASFDPQWGPAKTEAYVTRLAQQIGGLIRCSQPAPLLSGQFDMLVLECDIAGAISDAAHGMPIGYVVPKDAPLSDLWYMAVPRTGPDPAAGALLALFMLTKEGQAYSWNSDRGDLSLLPGSHTAALLPGSAPTITVQDFAAQPDALKYGIRYTKILMSVTGK